MKKLAAIIPGTSTNSADQDQDNSARSMSSSNHSNKINNSNSQTKSPSQVSPSRTLFPGHAHGVSSPSTKQGKQHHQKKYIANPNPNRGPANLALKHPFASTETSDISKENEPIASEATNDDDEDIVAAAGGPSSSSIIPMTSIQHASSSQMLMVEPHLNYKQRAAQKKQMEEVEAERAAVYWKKMINYGIVACVAVMAGCFGFFIYYAVKVMTGSL